MMKSLNGLRILNTRPTKQGRLLSQQITQAGGIAIEFPTIEIQKVSCDWLNKLPDLNNVDHALFISANAVEYGFEGLKQKKINWLNTINTIAIGQGTANALQRHNINALDMPTLPDSEHLLDLDSLQQIENQTILLFKGEGGRPLIEDTLRYRGAHVIILPVYRRLIPEIPHQIINSLWRDDAVDIILLTSEQSMQNLLNMFSAEAHPWLQGKSYLVISKRLAQIASLSGMKKIIISHPDKMMSTLFDYKGLIHGE